MRDGLKTILKVVVTIIIIYCNILLGIPRIWVLERMEKVERKNNDEDVEKSDIYVEISSLTVYGCYKESTIKSLYKGTVGD